MLLYLIRHAQSQNNAKPTEQRIEDPGITNVGHEQTRHLAKWIPELNLTRLITSPFRRALQTARPIQHVTSLTPEVRVELHERGGCYRGYSIKNIAGRPGMNREEIEREFPGYDLAAADIDGEGWWASKPQQSETEASLRAADLIRQTRQEFAGTNERVAFVMHADFKLLFLRHIHFEPLAVPCNTSVTTLQITPGDVQMVDYNRVAHLPRKLITR